MRGAWENGSIAASPPMRSSLDNQLSCGEAIKAAAALHQMQNLRLLSHADERPIRWYNTYLAYAIRNKVVGEEYKSYTAAQMNAPVTRGEFTHIPARRDELHTPCATRSRTMPSPMKVTDHLVARYLYLLSRGHPDRFRTQRVRSTRTAPSGVAKSRPLSTGYGRIRPPEHRPQIKVAFLIAPRDSSELSGFSPD